MGRGLQLHPKEPRRALQRMQVQPYENASLNDSVHDCGELRFVLTSSWIFRAKSRASRYGEIKAVIAMDPLSLNSLDTSATRRMFSSLSASVKPRFLLSPKRMLSPGAQDKIRGEQKKLEENG